MGIKHTIAACLLTAAAAAGGMRFNDLKANRVQEPDGLLDASGRVDDGSWYSGIVFGDGVWVAITHNKYNPSVTRLWPSKIICKREWNSCVETFGWVRAYRTTAFNIHAIKSWTDTQITFERTDACFHYTFTVEKSYSEVKDGAIILYKAQNYLA